MCCFPHASIWILISACSPVCFALLAPPCTSSYSFISCLEFAHYCMCRGECRSGPVVGVPQEAQGSRMESFRPSAVIKIANLETWRLPPPRDCGLLTSGLKKTSFNWHADCYPRGAGCPPPQGPHLGTEWGRCESVPGVDQTKKDC